MRNTRLSQAARASMTVDTPCFEESSLLQKADSPVNHTSSKLEIPEDLMAQATLMEESTH